MQLYLTIQGRVNFTQLARFGRSCESRFRQNFRKSIDWIAFNRTFLTDDNDRLWAIAIDPSYISKSGKKTPGLSYFWSGCANAARRGLEIMGLALVDGKSNDAFHKRAKELLELSKIVVADAYFSQKSFSDGLDKLGFSLVSRFRDGVRLKYLYTGPKLKKRGAPRKFTGRVDIDKLDMAVFKKFYLPNGSKASLVFWADVWSVALERKVRAVIVDCLDDKKTTQCRKVFFSTDLNLLPQDIIGIYTSRFQIEFLFRDAKQFMGLTNCQARNKAALAFAFNMSLSSINMARAFARQNNYDISIGSVKTLLHNAAMMERFISTFGKRPNLNFNNTDFKELLFYGVRNAS